MLIPCNLAIAAQAAQLSSCVNLRGSCDLVTIDRVCESGVLFAIVIVAPERTTTVPGAK